eukprot:403359608
MRKSNQQEDYRNKFHYMPQNEIDHVKHTLTNLGFHNHLNKIKSLGRDQYQIQFYNTSQVIADMYFFMGKAYFRRQVQNHNLIQDLVMRDENLEQAFFNFYTAALFGQREARAYLGIMYENGIIPNSQVIHQQVVREDGHYHFLKYLSDINQELIKDLKNINYTVFDFKQEMGSKSLIHLYLSTLQDPLYGEKPDTDLQDFSSQDQKTYDDYDEQLNQQEREKIRKQSVMASMILGSKYKFGLGVPERCKTSALYYEEAALDSINYVQQSHGLDVVERKKLNIGPHVLQDSVQVSEQMDDHVYNDFIDLLDLKGQYGNVESLSVLGIQHVHGTKRVKRDFEQAKTTFEKALTIDQNDKDSNYYMGLMHLNGLGMPVNVEAAMQYFVRAGNDSKAQNALGYVYYTAPDYFETDPVLLSKYGQIRQSYALAKDNFVKSAAQGNANAQYNLGCMQLNSKTKNPFSFSEAYDYFRKAAEKGHTFSAYNIAIMHLLGIGTFESCQIAQLFLKHVADVGQNTQELKTAYTLTFDERYKEAAAIYMELAEQGLAVAQLNAAILFDKYDIFDNEKVFITEVVTQELKRHGIKDGGGFNINKHLAFKYYTMASLQKETEDEAHLKLGDFYYYGISCNQSYDKAIELYKFVVQQSRDSEIRGQALFNLGMVHHFGMGLEVDLEMAQIYYEKAMKEESQALTPVYLLSLYGKWQKLDMVDTVRKFVSIHSDSPRSQITVVMMLFGYFFSFCGMVKFLRRDYKSNH